ncbi:zinc finger X-chromosomal protein-like isoform 3-T4 [Cochliomyia hominivorax]
MTMTFVPLATPIEIIYSSNDMYETNTKTRSIILEENENFDNYIKDKGEDENIAILNNKNNKRKPFKNRNQKDQNTNMYKCLECQLEFKLLDDLKRHMGKHAYKGSFICQIYSETFTQKDNLRKYLRGIHGEKQFSCNVCDKKFAARYTLLQHIQTDRHKKCSISQTL